MTGPELVALVVAAVAALWSAGGGSRVGSITLLVAVEAVIMASAFGTGLAPEVGWAGALGAILVPYGPAVWIGWAAGTAAGAVARVLGLRIRRARTKGPAADLSDAGTSGKAGATTPLRAR